MANDVLKIGVIGAGYWGPNLIRNFNQLGGSDVVACADLSEDRLSHIGSLYHQIHTTQDYRELLDNDEISAIVIATPPKTHFDLAMDAIKAGKHVFVEKPLALTLEELARIEEALTSEAAGRILMVGFNRRFAPATERLRQHFQGVAEPLTLFGGHRA